MTADDYDGAWDPNQGASIAYRGLRGALGVPYKRFGDRVAGMNPTPGSPQELAVKLDVLAAKLDAIKQGIPITEIRTGK